MESLVSALGPISLMTFSCFLDLELLTLDLLLADGHPDLLHYDVYNYVCYVAAREVRLEPAVLLLTCHLPFSRCLLRAM